MSLLLLSVYYDRARVRAREKEEVAAPVASDGGIDCPVVAHTTQVQQQQLPSPVQYRRGGAYGEVNAPSLWLTADLQVAATTSQTEKAMPLFTNTPIQANLLLCCKDLSIIAFFVCLMTHPKTFDVRLG